ncbi:glycosyltransferase [Aureisphaera galaxeae]|uniref:glycosyltransferase n=1 Tax=Aureisphaera galaxeae TaxID=1538023 RepID=UPI002350F26B|nr:glycosyltransferase [Aureisphaera galaxeae]MDC8006282.1 glycosyltransferase [Aureisphaera galaxeae]
MNIALFSPNQKAYSETFIQAHKNGLKGKVFYYYGAGQNIRLENTSRKSTANLVQKVWGRISGKPTFNVQDWLQNSLAENNIDVALVEYGNHAHHLLPVFQDNDIPLVVHFHGYDAVRKDIVKGCDNYREVFKRANKVIAVSKKMQKSLEQMGCAKDKLVHTACGANPAFKEISPNFSKKQLLSVGRFVDKKAPYYTLLAFSKVVQSHPEAKLTMAGTGPLWDTCVNLSKHLGLESRVTFLGVVTPETIQELLRETQVFVQHSITTSNGDQEGTPVGVMEASLAGVPVVATRHAGIPDVILDGETGYLVQEHDVDLMAQRIGALLGDVSLSKKMGDAGKKLASENFTLDHHLDAVNKTLKEAVA